MQQSKTPRQLTRRGWIKASASNLARKCFTVSLLAALVQTTTHRALPRTAYSFIHHGPGMFTAGLALQKSKSFHDDIDFSLSIRPSTFTAHPDLFTPNRCADCTIRLCMRMVSALAGGTFAHLKRLQPKAHNADSRFIGVSASLPSVYSSVALSAPATNNRRQPSQTMGRDGPSTRITIDSFSESTMVTPEAQGA
jgi:hypothetical protein